ncbi:Peroxidase 4 [Linum perenne]
MIGRSSSLVVMAVAILVMVGAGKSSAQLNTNFYSKSCPNLMKTIRSAVQSAVSKETRMAASLIRLHFHDCFVNLLEDTSSFTGEQTARPNAGSVRGFNVIEDIKSKVEKVCPGVVSCADILAIAARDSTVIAGGKSWKVRLGRRDSTTLSQLINRFQAKGLSAKDMVVLSGSHTIGQARCTTFRTRIYNETNINPSFARDRRGNCPRAQNSGNNNLAVLDVKTPKSFDNQYYKNLIELKGLLHSDQILFNGGSTDSLVRSYSRNPKVFASDFATAMIKMGNIDPLTGSRGEIRKKCSRRN